MRLLVVALALVACKKDTPPAPAVGGASGSAAVADAGTPDAPGALIELLHNMPAHVTVSSRVSNKKILPQHLVDHDPSTAWNSMTGELQDAWMMVTLAAPAEITELRMTVGHTGKGPKGEDYFTMNPRIKTVTVLHDKTVLVTTALDPDRRDVQTIALPQPITDHVRIRVDAVVMGSKPTWRETCVSELEVWGRVRAPTVAKPTTPSVEVGDPIDEPPQVGPIPDPTVYCKGLIAGSLAGYKAAQESSRAAWADCKRRNDPNPNCGGNTDEPEEPSCNLNPTTPVAIGPWITAGTFVVSNDPLYGQTMMQPAVQTADGWWMVGTPVDCAPFSDRGACKLTITSSTVKNDQLTLDYKLDGRVVDTWQITCTVNAEKTATCTTPLMTSAPTP